MTNSPRFTKSANTVRHALVSQIPSFYNSEGPNFVRFINTYFQFLEDDVLATARSLQATGDIDVTPDDCLIYFNNKFTFGASRAIRTLPSVITGDLRFIIKHIKDVYRSKGTERGTKLFFRIAFNDSPEIFIPGDYMFAPSASDFRRPNIVEITEGFQSKSDTNALQGQIVRGSITGATAIVANVFRKKIGQKSFTYLELDNTRGTFLSGDKIVVAGSDRSTTSVSPEVVGPVREVEIIDGSSNIPRGTTFTALPVADGVDLKVSAKDFEFLLGGFDPNPIEGTNYSDDALVTVTRAPLETDNVSRGRFRVSTKNETFTEGMTGDIIQTWNDQTIGTSTFYDVTFDSANVLNEYHTAGISDVLSSEERTFGNIKQLIATETPASYTLRPFVRVEDVVFTDVQDGTISLSNTLVTGTGTLFDKLILAGDEVMTGTVDVIFGNTLINGIGTSFTTDFVVNDVIKVGSEDDLPLFFTIKSIANNTLMNVQERPVSTSTGAVYGGSHNNYIKLIDSAGEETIRVVNTHISNTSMYLDDKVLIGELSSFSNLTYQIGYPVGDITFTEEYETNRYNIGEDASFTYELVSDSGSVKGVQILNAGFGYNPEDEIIMKSENLTPVVNFTNGGGSGASAFAEIDNDGTISNITVTDPGSGYDFAPTVSLEGGTGSGASATAVIEGGSVIDVIVDNVGAKYVREARIVLKPIKSGQSILEGRAIEMRSEPSTHLRIQDSNYWQEYSYEIGSGVDAERYRETVDDLLHMAGRKFFTKGLIKDDVNRTGAVEETITAT